MPSIFSGIRAISDGDLRLEIALMENITLGNAVRETGVRAIGKLTALAGSLAGMLAPKTEEETGENQAADICDRVEKRCVELSGLSRELLERKMKTLLSERCREFMPPEKSSEEMAVSEDCLSVILIREGAKIYGIPPLLAPSVKAEEIYKKYEEQMLSCLLKELKSETGEAARNRDIRLQTALNEASIEAKRHMQKRLVLDEFSGRGLGNAIRSSGSIKRLGIIVECVGLEPFPLARAYIGAAFQAMKGVHRLKRAMFCHLVWRVVLENGGRFTVSSDLLPSFVPGDIRAAEEAKERQYMKQMAAKRELFSSMEKARILTERYEQELAVLMETTTEEEDPVRVKQLKNNLTFAQKQMEDFTSQYEGLNAVTARETAQKSTRLKVAWEAFFPRFDFELQVFERAAERYTCVQLQNLERMLKEMHDSIDIQAYSNERREQDGIELDCAVCQVSAGCNAAIVFSGNHILDV